MTRTEDCFHYAPLSDSPGYTAAVEEGLVTIDGEYLCHKKLPLMPTKDEPAQDISCVKYGNPGCPKTDK